LIGEDRTGGSVHREVQSLGIDGSVTLTGPLPGDQVADMMRRSRIFCLPSHNEGTPVCIMEALSCGLPVVATRVGGIPDVVEHEKTGLLVAKGNVQGVADALLSLFRDPSRCVQMGKEARAFADTHLDIARTANRLVELYRTTMDNYGLSEH
jgi:glycosyltransferase involved in cell wall biosynthesis